MHRAGMTKFTSGAVGAQAPPQVMQGGASDQAVLGRPPDGNSGGSGGVKDNKRK